MAALSSTIKGLGKAQLGMLAGVGILLLGFFAIIALRISAPTFTTMYTNLSLEDSAKIVSELEQQGIPYQIRANGSEVAVPSDKMLRMRMTMAERGLPSTGNVMGYELFDKSDTLGSSQFVMNVNKVRALEGELARTIGELAQIESARIHLVIPKQELFSKDKIEPTASVILKLRGNMELEKTQVAAIVNLVAAAVPGLKASKVTVVDSFGRLLAKSEEEGSLGAAVSTAEEHRVIFENSLKAKLESLVERIVGPGRVKVQVTADVNYDRVVTKKETFDPEGQVVRSTQSTTSNEKAQDSANKDSVSAANQLPAAQGAGAGPSEQSQRDNNRNEEVTNYEISKTMQDHIKEGGSVNKLSVAVLVDGLYSKKDGDTVYAARGDEDMQKIQQLVKSAIGFDEKRGDTVEVINMRFVTAEDVEIKPSFWEKYQGRFEGIIQTLIISVVVVLVIMLVIRPAVMHVIRTTAPATERIAEGLASMGAAAGGALKLPGGGAAPVPGMVGYIPGAVAGMGGGMSAQQQQQPQEEEVMLDIGNVKGRVRSGMIKKVTEFVDQNPEESLMVVRQWMMKEA